MISDSLLARARVRPASRAASVAVSPAAPVTPLSTTSAGHAASSSIASGPSSTTGIAAWGRGRRGWLRGREARRKTRRPHHGPFGQNQGRRGARPVGAGRRPAWPRRRPPPRTRRPGGPAGRGSRRPRRAPRPGSGPGCGGRCSGPGCRSIRSSRGSPRRVGRRRRSPTHRAVVALPRHPGLARVTAHVGDQALCASALAEAMTAWQAKASAPAAKIGWSSKAAASSWALIFRAIPSRILSSALGGRGRWSGT